MAKKKGQSVPEKAIKTLFAGENLKPGDLKQLQAIGESLIDQFMQSVGYTDPASRTDPNGWRHLQLESAEGVAGIRESDGELFLHVEGVVMPLPSDKDLIQALMRAALELNCTLPGPCRLGIRGSMLVASATQNMRALKSPEEYGSLIHLVMALTNTIDDGFMEKYSGTTRARATAAATV